MCQILTELTKMRVGTLDSYVEEVPEHSLFLVDNLLAPTQVSDSKNHVSQRGSFAAAPLCTISVSSTLLGRDAELNVDKSQSE